MLTEGMQPHRPSTTSREELSTSQHIVPNINWFNGGLHHQCLIRINEHVLLILKPRDRVNTRQLDTW